MTNYDEWKTDNPYYDEDEIYLCDMCSTPIETEGYCSTKCRKADD